jgi:cytochrome c6
VKRMISVLIAALAIALTLLPAPVMAADLANGAKVFSANCAACHAGGANLVNPAKTLKKADLEKFEMASLDAIKTQVTNGKGAMPGFKTRLTADQIEDVANYVLDQANKGWS